MPRPVVGTAAIMAEAQCISRWVGGPTKPHGFTSQKYAQTPQKPGAANRIPPEIAAKISKYLDVKDLGRAALAWRPVALASYASPEFIKLECGRYSLMTNGFSRWSPDTMYAVRMRMEQYNFAWSTLQYASSLAFSLPHTTQDTPWAGHEHFKSGNCFMGESNGYMYDVSSWEASGPQGEADASKTETGLKTTQINLVLQKHFVKAVTVDPVEQIIGILEFNTLSTYDVYSRIPILHVYNLNGQHLVSTQIRIGFQTGAEIYHLEMHGEMVCIIANYSSTESLIGIASDINIQNWTGKSRAVHLDLLRYPSPPGTPGYTAYCTGFQFITEDLWIATSKTKTDRRDTIPTHHIHVGHVRLDKQTIIALRDVVNEKGWTPNNISLIRNVSHSSPVSGLFYGNSESRLFGLKWEYRDCAGAPIRANACLFGRTTVEAWLGVPYLVPQESLHWIKMPIPDTTKEYALEGYHGKPKPDPTNREGLYIVGRRLFWAQVWPYGWSFNVLDYNPGAGNWISAEIETRGEEWKTVTGLFCNDPYAVAFSTTCRIYNVARVVPTEDGILIKHGAADYTMLLM
ncbi:hypothetical protein MVEN_01349300 [Mycena venus]|uniref:F-box domain-containing protein n=1 Tax=Mycena venus TaxID=2733690 RepID=A0A8H7CWC1_9AGAR|nr:hypothetical protein MVEN_01349300 [Mycena venus]